MFAVVLSNVAPGVSRLGDGVVPFPLPPFLVDPGIIVRSVVGVGALEDFPIVETLAVFAAV